MNVTRPNPDALLTEVAKQEARARRGKLKIFFGANAGVGKTYAMLEAAQRRKQEGVDVVVGYVELHGRIETERLLAGLEHLTLLPTDQRDVDRMEFDMEAALQRHPQLLLIDELAHTNLRVANRPLRHVKRWQDIEEILDRGIDVYTTVNVQHLESLSDVVTQITGVPQRETLPDRIFEDADEVELIDLPPDDLLQRLHAGKVYVREQAQLAMENFFRKGNLIALRELALRKTADRVDQAMHEYRTENSVRRPWAARERILVCLGPGTQAEQLVRAGKRLADGLDAEWIVVYVETPDLYRLSEVERNRRIALMRLGESLGAEAITLGGSAAAAEILGYAHTRNVTHIVIGKSTRRLWHFHRSTTDELIRTSEFDVVVIGRDAQITDRASMAKGTSSAVVSPHSQKPRWPQYIVACSATVAATVLCWFMFPAFESANLVMVYLLSAALVAVYCGRRATILTSVLNVLVYDFVFVPPRYSFAVADVQYLLTFTIMLAVALIIGSLNASVRLQAKVAGHRERRTALLYAMSRQLTATRDRKSTEHLAIGHVSEVFDCKTAILLPNEAGQIVNTRERHSRDSLLLSDAGIAQWVYDHHKSAGLGTDTLSGTNVLYLPLLGVERNLGVLAVKPRNARQVMLPEQFRLLETFAGQIALAIERIDLADQAHAADLRAETESVRNSLLASMSHDLRTPLSTVVAGAITLAERMEDLNPQERHLMAVTVRSAAQHVSEHLTGILDLVQLESSAIKLRLDSYALDEIVGTVLFRLKERLRQHVVVLDLPVMLPSLRVDGKLIEQVFENLVDNAVKYTPSGSEIRIAATATQNQVEVIVTDNGSGFEGVKPELLFEKFQRGKKESTIGGIGLGLAICRAIISLHRGRTWAEEIQPHGAAIHFTLPITDLDSDTSAANIG